jgi:hypothetical protein
VQLEFEEAVARRHRHERTVERVGDGAGQVVEAGLDDHLDRRRDIAAVVGENGCSGADLGDTRRGRRIHAEAVIEAPGAQPVSNRGQFRMCARVSVFGEHTSIRRQRPRNLVEASSGLGAHLDVVPCAPDQSGTGAHRRTGEHDLALDLRVAGEQ